MWSEMWTEDIKGESREIFEKENRVRMMRKRIGHVQLENEKDNDNDVK